VSNAIDSGRGLGLTSERNQWRGGGSRGWNADSSSGSRGWNADSSNAQWTMSNWHSSG